MHSVDSLVRIGKFNPIDTVGLKQNLQKVIVEKSTNPFGQKDDGRNKLTQLLQNQNQVKLDTVKFKKNPPLKLKISIDSAKTVLAKNKLELGNLFLTELDVPDSSYALYTENIERYPSTIYYPNTLYALGSYYLTVNQQTKADSLFRIIYDDYKDRKIVNDAANRINLPLIDLDYDPAKDEYAAAEDLMLDKNYSNSVSKFFNIYKDYPKSPVAPQALYTTGWILENDLLLLDSAAAVYDTLVAKYPTSVYVKNVAKKVTTYKQEKARRQKAILDSLNVLKQLEADSLLAVNREVNSEDTLKFIEDENPADETQQLEKDEKMNQVVVGNEPPDPRKKIEQVSKKKLEPLWDPRKHRQ
jgi:outer membrane protein assembly factor BamD (BamD/ComL family)